MSFRPIRALRNAKRLLDCHRDDPAQRYFSYTRKLPLDDTAILIDAFGGMSFDGSSFYIARELIEDSSFRQFKVYVAVNDASVENTKRKFPSEILSSVEFVTYGSDAHLKLLACARYLVTNALLPRYFSKRSGQVVLNTWHGTNLKELGRKHLTKLGTIDNIQRNLLMADYLLIPNDHSFEHFIKGCMVEKYFDGTYVYADYPQNAVLKSEVFRKAIRRDMQLDDKRVLAYLPTWREDSRGNPDVHFLELFRSFLEYMDRSFDDDIVMFVKMHHTTAVLGGGSIDFGSFSHIREFPEDRETYQFLSACDALLTDYSSIAFDFAESEREVVLFPFDKEEYTRKVPLTLKLEELPFFITQDVESLVKHLNRIQLDKCFPYESFRARFSPWPHKNTAHELACLLISGSCALRTSAGREHHNGNRNVLISVGTLKHRNDANQSLASLLSRTDTAKTNYLILFNPDGWDTSDFAMEFLTSLDPQISFMPRIHTFRMTRAELLCKELYYRKGWCPPFVKRRLMGLFQREFERMLPGIEFDQVVDYQGSDRESTLLLISYQQAQKGRIKHDETVRERGSSVSFLRDE